jgi:thiol:disulfide interchange protein DsbD
MLDPLANGQVTLAAIWLLGVSMGLTACTVTCLPFMGTWALGRASGQGEAFLHTGVFLAGRVCTYTYWPAAGAGARPGKAWAALGQCRDRRASILAGLWHWQNRPARAAAPYHQRRRLLKRRYASTGAAPTACRRCSSARRCR